MTHNGKFAYASRRSANKVALVDLDNQTFEDVLTLALPDTLRLSANEKLLTVGLRSTPAQLAVVDTSTFEFDLVTNKGNDIRAFQQLWNKNNPSDKIVEDGRYSPVTEQRLKQAPADGFKLGPSCSKPSSPKTSRTRAKTAINELLRD